MKMNKPSVTFSTLDDAKDMLITTFALHALSSGPSERQEYLHAIINMTNGKQITDERLKRIKRLFDKNSSHEIQFRNRNIGEAEELDENEDISDYKSEISFEQALDELHDAAHEHEKNPSRATKRRLNEAEKNLAKAKMDFAVGDVCNIRDGRKGIDANPAKWKKYWDTMTRGKAHKKSAIVKALKKAHAKIKSPMAFAKALEERFG